jgi:septal ring factor EnvC (AmiA/AmiB activator)
MNLRKATTRILVIGLIVGVCLQAGFVYPAHAQSGAEYREWVNWCRSIGGTPNSDASNPVCSPRSSGRSGRTNRTEFEGFPATPDPLPALVTEYQSLRGWFNSPIFSDAPAVVSPSNLSDVHRAATSLEGYARSKLYEFRERNSALEKRERQLLESIRQQQDFSNTVRTEIANYESAVASSNSALAETQHQLNNQNGLNDQISSLMKQMEDEARAAKARLFNALYDAAQRGLIKPPSAYNAAPKPVDPIYGRPGNQATLGQPLQPASLAAARASSIQPATLVAPSAAGPWASSPATEENVRQKLTEIRGLIQPIREADSNLRSTTDRFTRAEQGVSSASSLVASLHQTLEARRTAAALASNSLSAARAKLNDAVASYTRQREKFPFQALELGFLKYYEKQVRDLIKQLPGMGEVLPAVNTKGLTSLAKVAQHSVQMNNESLKVIERVPAAMIEDAEDPTALIKELEDIVNRFKANLFNDLTGIKLLRYSVKSEP